MRHRGRVAATPSPTSSCTASQPAARSTTAATPPAAAMRLRLTRRNLPAGPAARRVLRHARAGRDADHRARCGRTGPTVSPTASPSGAYLVVVPHREPRCRPGACCVPQRRRPLRHLLPQPPHQRSHHCRQLPQRLALPAARRGRDSCDRSAATRSVCAKRCGRASGHLREALSGRPNAPARGRDPLPHRIAELQAVRGPVREPSCPDVGSRGAERITNTAHRGRAREPRHRQAASERGVTANAARASASSRANAPCPAATSRWRRRGRPSCC